MKTKKGYFWLFIISSFCFIWGLNANAFAAVPIELSYAEFFPPTYIQAKLTASWAKEVERRTRGKVKIVYYPAGSLLKGGMMYSGIKSGIADIGHSGFIYNKGVFTAMESFSLPHGFESGTEATRVVNEFSRNFKLKEFAAAKILYLHALGPAMLHSKAKVTKLSDLRGMRVRSSGSITDMVKLLGGIPVSMTQSKVYESLAKGVADATLSPIEVLKRYKQAEVIEYTLQDKSIAYSNAFYVMMNLEKWNSLPKDVQQTIDQVSQEWAIKHGQAWDSSDDEGRKYTLAQNNKILKLSKAESAKWSKALHPVIAKYVNKANKKGLPGQAYVDFIKFSVERE